MLDIDIRCLTHSWLTLLALWGIWAATNEKIKDTKERRHEMSHVIFWGIRMNFPPKESPTLKSTLMKTKGSQIADSSSHSCQHLFDTSEKERHIFRTHMRSSKIYCYFYWNFWLSQTYSDLITFKIGSCVIYVIARSSNSSPSMPSHSNVGCLLYALWTLDDSFISPFAFLFFLSFKPHHKLLLLQI